MTNPPARPARLAGLVHQFLEHATAIKVLVGSLRLRLRRGDVAPVEVEARLDEIEQQVDTAAELAETIRTETPPSL
jgi:hypothetical protein